MYPVSILTALAAFILVLCAAQGVRMVSYDAARSLSMEENVASQEKGSLVIKLVDRAGLRFSRLLSGAYGPRRRARLESRLKRAGYPAGLTQRKFIQRETGFVVLGIIVLLFCFLIDELIIGVGLGLLLAFWMQVWLTNTGLRRSQQIDRDLPDFLDVLSVTVRSGMSFRPAVERVSSFHEGPLAEEMRGAIYSMRLGVTRRDAFIAARDNSRSENVAIFVSAFLQAEELGTPLADALVDISSEIRRERAQQVRRAAARAQPKIAIVVTTMILPATLILILGSMILMNAGIGS
ncbi:type II secretion system F family protein [Actinomyces sp. oral taxon 170]|jgi:integral membrane protein|uniref:type II secretion system F family protein n=1 Tax=Actinomyces sp. oral taxon 170 TaxID=712117 RepID=UPI000205E8DF|nr:type II secretion system F family protein [Actinomyces sp. oral taxon 170]EGF58418.1 bacterial type II secretion system protein F domain protein [Actinomyces sp. oral taxon 170 str. F0386]